MSQPIRVLVIDDSALMRKLISQILSRDPDIQVVGTAMDGEFGLKKIEELAPQVVTLDLQMPRMDGMEALRQITRRYRLPVIMVSAMTTEGATSTFKALALGALDFVAKPRDAAAAKMDEIAGELISKIKSRPRQSLARRRRRRRSCRRASTNLWSGPRSRPANL
jgi:two-component system, chemotaxis family, protein-glutamate methylesterase/glutaminase